MHQTINVKALSPKDRQRLVAEAKYLLLYVGMSQAQTATALQLTRKTVCAWAKDYGWRNKLKKLNTPQKVAALGLDDSLSAFMAHCRIHNNELYNILAPAYLNFTQNIK